MSPKRNHLFRKIAIAAIGITLILFLCLPTYASWVPEAWDGWEAGWNDVYIFEDEIMLIGLIPFYILFPLMLLTKKKPLKILFKVLLFLSRVYILPTDSWQPDYLRKTMRQDRELICYWQCFLN